MREDIEAIRIAIGRVLRSRYGICGHCVRDLSDAKALIDKMKIKIDELYYKNEQLNSMVRILETNYKELEERMKTK